MTPETVIRTGRGKLMWEEIYRRHYRELLRYCSRACGSQEAAEDLVQEAFLKALQNADTFEELGPNQQRAWLYRTVKNLIVDRYRFDVQETQYIQTTREDEESDESGFGTAETYMLLQQLPEQDRVLFRMRYIEGYNASELAEIFHLPPGTVRSKLSRSKVFLKKLMTEI